jgi:hypothetical protein
VRRFKEWAAEKKGLRAEDFLFPVSGRVPGTLERKTHKMMQVDLEAAHSGAQISAKDLASAPNPAASGCIENNAEPNKNGDPKIAVSAYENSVYCVSPLQDALFCTVATDALSQYPRRDSNTKPSAPEADALSN